jgi:sarcosine oxidase subunit delta
MLRLYCPYCDQIREEEEFSYAGEAFIARPADPDNADDGTWGDYLFMRRNPKGWFWEQWQHTAACRKVFAVRRNTATYAVDQCLPLAQAKPLFDADNQKGST